MGNNLVNLTIGVFAKAVGVNVETIRFYQRKGLLPEPSKPHGSIRRYGETDVMRVRFVKSAQRLGFSLDEIAELLRLEDGTHCDEASSLPSFPVPTSAVQALEVQGTVAGSASAFSGAP